MRAPSRSLLSAGFALLISAALAVSVGAQGRGGGGRGDNRQAVPRPPIELRVPVFIGGYFYNPQFGPYPWWLPRTYPHHYFPVYERRAELRVRVKPVETAVYVDGFYAGIVDDFDGIFERLPVTPGAHDITLYLQGYRTERRSLYLGPMTTMDLRWTMERLPAGEESEPPRVAPPLPPPPPGSYRGPRTPPPPVNPGRPLPPVLAEGFGTLELMVLPAGAKITIDDDVWQSADGRRFVIEVASGRHHIEISLEGYNRFSKDIEVRDGEISTLNVILSKRS